MRTNEQMGGTPTLPPFAILAIEHNGFLELSSPAPRLMLLRAPWMAVRAAERTVAASERAS